jgi:type I restriction enzyme M protein
VHDPWKRNIYGVPPQGCADYAFFQHIICSLKENSGRCAILWPHGVLFRDSEQEMRAKLVDSDLVDCVIGLGKNLFYNSVMEACIVICRKNKPKIRKGKVLFINGLNEVIQGKQMAHLSQENIKNLFDLYTKYENLEGLSYVADFSLIKSNNYSLNVPLYVQKYDNDVSSESLVKTMQMWEESSKKLKIASSDVFATIKEVISNEK